MKWPRQYFKSQAENLVSNFDLTPAELDVVLKEWNEEIESIPDNWYDNLPPDHEERHALAVLQRIALKHLRRRSLTT